MEYNYNMDMLEKAVEIVRKLKDNGHEAVFAGGCVRDMLLEIDYNDIDIATSATPDEVEKLFDKTIPVGKSFGVIIVIDGEDSFEVATFRSDGDYSDGRRPDSVEFTSMEEDAKRRDFTINAMFYDPIEDMVIDFFDGKGDLYCKTLRFVGNASDRINEDQLRMLRAIRFLVKYNLGMESGNWETVKKYSNLISNVSNERIIQEIFKMLELHNPRKLLHTLRDSKLLYHILPEADNIFEIKQPEEFHPEIYLEEHIILSLDALKDRSPSSELLFATLLHDIGKPPTQTFEDRIRFNGHDEVGAKMAGEICDRFKLSNDQKDKIVFLVANHMRTRFVKEMKKSKLKRLMASPHFEDLMELHRADCLASHGGLDKYDYMKEKLVKFREEVEEKSKLPKPFVMGRDLANMGFKACPSFGKVLKEVMDMQLNEEFECQEDALSYAYDMMNKLIKEGGNLCIAEKMKST